MARDFIPSSIDECSPEWLTHVLRERGALREAHVKEREIEYLGEGEGFMGTTARLRLELDRDEPGAPASLIAKLPTMNRRVRAHAEALGIYEREVFFYDEFASKLPDPAPRCFYGAMDPNPTTPEAQLRTLEFLERAPTWVIRALIPVGNGLARLSRRRYVMLLEDLAPMRVGDQVEGGSASELEAMLRHLARMHAHFWNSPELESHHWLPPLDASPRPILLMYEKALPRFMKEWGQRTSEGFRSIQQWLLDHGVEFVRALARGPQTLIHGDFRLDNVFFDAHGSAANGSGVVLFDWQIPCRGPGAYDLGYFLSSTLAPAVSRDDEHSFIRIYYDELVRGGVRDYDFEALRRDYQRAVVLQVQRIATSLPAIDVSNDRGQQLFERWVERLDARVSHLDPNVLLAGEA